MRWLNGLAIVLAAILAPAVARAEPAPSPQPTGLQSDIPFTETSPYSRNVEMARRLATPLEVLRLNQNLARRGALLGDQPVDPAAERFTLYVPATAPPHGYGLVVFVPPWPEARLPDGWAAALDKQGVIFVTPAGAGNDEAVLGRRDPLALIAAQNVLDRYLVDPMRVYVAGFSGGSHTAQELALGYPDLFRGVLLIAGSDPIGEAHRPPPSGGLFSRFQAGSRIVYLTGASDAERLEMDDASQASMRAWCQFDVASINPPGLGHATPSGADFALALRALETPKPPDPAKLAACQAGVERQLASRLGEIDALIAVGKLGEARQKLDDVDRRYGGLAAPRSLDLAARLAPTP
jgi:pimeloyl-ACP methyl ester carboxylesterase